MKKLIIVFLFVISIVPITIKAESKFSTWTTILPEDTTNLIIESETRYKWYKEKQVNISYDLIGESKKQFVDKNDYKYSNIMQSITYPEEKTDRVISSTTLDVLYDKSLVKFINIFGMRTTGKLKITELTIKDKKTQEIVEYTVEDCEMCDGYSVRLNDNNKNEIALYVQTFVNILINFKEFHYLDDLEITFTYLNDSVNLTNFSIGFSHFKTKPFSYAEYNQKNYILECNDFCEIKADFNEIKINISGVWQYEVYTYRDKLYKHYDIYKEYLPDYYTNVENYLKDETTALMFYRYKQKEVNKIVETITYKTIEIPINHELEEINVEKEIIEVSDNNKKETDNSKKETVAYLEKETTKKKNSYLLYVEIFVILSVVTTLFYVICKHFYKKRK